MESIYRDAYPDVFATFDDYEFFLIDLPLEKIEKADKEGAENVEVLSK